MSALDQSEVWRDKESKGIFTIISHGLDAADLTPVTIYKSLFDGLIWVSPTADFEDGFYNIAIDEVAP
jgi:hypothetical protein